MAISTGQKKFLGIMGVALLITAAAFAVYYFFFRKTVPTLKPNPNAPPKNPVSTTFTGTAQKGNDNFPLKLGSVGPNVKSLQQALNIINGDKKLAEDGQLAQMTYNSILTTLGTNYYPVTQDLLNMIVEEATAIANSTTVNDGNPNQP